MYNDWESLKMVLKLINSKLIGMKKIGSVIIINDSSKEKNKNFINYSNINEISVLNLSENVGSQKAISIGLKYISNELRDKYIVTVLDSDGEDDVDQIPSMIEMASRNFNKVIVSCRTKRQEKPIFKFLYFCHKLLTLFFTLKWISFGNYSSFFSDNIKNILKNDKSWLAFSACLSHNCKILRLHAPRRTRLIGESNLSLKGLINHALRIYAVFLVRLNLLTLLYIFFIYLFFNFSISIYFIVSISILYISVILTYFFNNQKQFIDATNLIGSVDKF